MCSEGNPGMASGGMGDALTGIIAALIAQGLSLEEAAAAGVCLHAAAGDLAATQGGERGLLASDLIAALRPVLNRRNWSPPPLEKGGRRGCTEPDRPESPLPPLAKGGN